MKGQGEARDKNTRSVEVDPLHWVIALVRVEIVIPVESVEDHEAGRKDQNEDDVHQPTTTEYGFLTESPGV